MYRSIRSLISLSRAFELLPLPPPFGAKLCWNARPNFFCKRQNQRPWLPWHGPSLKARPCRPFFGHSHAKVNYLPLTPPYLKITLVFRWKDWTLPVLIPHSQPSKVVTGLPEGGGAANVKPKYWMKSRQNTRKYEKYIYKFKETQKISFHKAFLWRLQKKKRLYWNDYIRSEFCLCAF